MTTRMVDVGDAADTPRRPLAVAAVSSKRDRPQRLGRWRVHCETASTVARDGTHIGFVSAGAGPPLLLVHGGMADHTMWASVLARLASSFRVTAMDRRGRGLSPDVRSYSLQEEFYDVLAVADRIAADAEATVDVVGHSIGATCVLGAAAARGERFGRIVLYEPPGPATAPVEWVDVVAGYIAAGQPGRAMASFLQERIGLSSLELEQLRRSPTTTADWAAVVTTTMVREGRALADADLAALAQQVTTPVTLVLGAHSPPWATDIVAELHRTLPRSDVVTVAGQGHQAIINDPGQIAGHIRSALAS